MDEVDIPEEKLRYFLQQNTLIGLNTNFNGPDCGSTQGSDLFRAQGTGNTRQLSFGNGSRRETYTIVP